MLKALLPSHKARRVDLDADALALTSKFLQSSMTPAGVETNASIASSTLRQGRLLAAAQFLAVGSLVGTVLQWLANGHFPTAYASVTALQSTACLFLSRPQLSRRQLLSLEWLVFGLSSTLIAITQYQGMLSWAARAHPLELQAAIKNAHMASMLLLFAYAMLIPNSWKTASRVIAGITLVPVVTATFAILSNPGVRRFVRQEEILQQSGANLLMMLFAAVLSVYGVHVLNTLRHEAQEAQRLNQYQLGDLIGSGGMGDVYLAEHRLLKRSCAIKLIRESECMNPKALEDFEREVRSAARLSHPNIVDIYDYGHAEDGRFYYVMEYLKGMSLEELIDQRGPQSPSRVIHILHQICDGLADAHAAGLIHRDLKPANIFVANIGQRRDVAKILDFGVVKDIAASTSEEPSPEAISGTPQYMAPEQATNSVYLDHRADIYALGGVAYFLLTGRAPFEGQSAVALMVAHATQTVAPPSQWQAELSGELERIVMKCLEKLPSDRFQNATELRCALSECEEFACRV